MWSSCEGQRRLRLAPSLDHVAASAGLWSERSTSRQAERDAAVRNAVATALTEKQREVVEAYFFEGASQAAIAERLGITQQVVQKRLFGAVRDGRVVGGAMARLRDALSALDMVR